ncbi:arginyltransferase [Hoeflea prorocentri]|uniref:Aspartate/glutamate leucyltransferase n=1 Tax=Hoeflea prorocentri TaxID=1922333 RepID=A0A9X3ZI09_9HYPH|nr:arginyltransferase [Hoeflea prorocentri]MCY6381255.1 arginyltransferase [Hoeflea prorocentri]MDA5399055.1 arginyltransferase [Hoeflea prorocentri]
MTNQPVHSPQFFLTAPSPCPYLDGQFERKVFTHLVGEKAAELNDLLTQGGFRRSQNIAYRPACETCRACISVRILAGEFKPNRSMKRIIARNDDLVAQEFPAEPSSEQYSLFRGYLDARHQEGGMSDMTVLDYAMMVEDTHVPTRVIEYRIGADGLDGDDSERGKLIAVALSDLMGDGLSMVYSFFDPDYSDRSLGTYMILDHIVRAQDRGLPHVYLGYWVAGSSKMDYKTRFLPQEHLMSGGWERYEG